ncbi:SusC/RagA family TonB-linked outer membrane protein, partial [Hymenobacter terrenus]|uniref:SusC/RagA family TonB-linked outer membrane protein n=1 Tax=Hymenobacter terrenus TaxID=1629124 RepID=UPI000619C5CB
TDTKQLNEVVVTALGIERETKSLGFSTQQVQGDAVTQSGETNIVQGLAAKAAGVQVVGSAGVPGASSKILIRGNNSFIGDNQPLFVIDGIPLDNQTNVTEGADYPFNANLQGVANSNRAIDINPNDIETFNVLKGPAAAALYGSRAGNGAIIITTKRGKANQKATVSFRSEVELTEVNRLLDRQLKYAQGTGGGNQRDATGALITPNYNTYTPGNDGIFDRTHADEDSDDNPGTSQIWGPTNSSLDITPVDNAENFFKTGISYTNDLSIAAGNDRGAVRFSLGQLRNEGIVPNTSFNRYTLRLTADTKLSDKITLGGTVNYINSGGVRAQQGSNTSGVMLGLMRAPSSFDLAAGYKYDSGPNRGYQRNYFQAYDNPYWTVNENPTRDDNSRILGNLTLTYNPLPWLRIMNRGGGDIYTDRRKSIFAIYSNGNPGDLSGEIRENTRYHRELYNDLTATGSFNLTEKLFASLTVGNNINERYDQNLFARGQQLAVPGFYNLSNAATRYADEQTSTIRSFSYFYDANFSFNDFVFVGTTGRYDNFSTFGPNAGGFFAPSVNASVVLSELPGFKSIENIANFIKIRGAIGKAGNQPPFGITRNYFVAPFFTDGFTNGLSFPYAGVNGSGLSGAIGNLNLRPEQVLSREVGTELHLNKDKITIDFTYYNNRSSDLILNRPVSSGSGFTSTYENAGEISNRGIEVVVGLKPFTSEKGFNWNMQFNYTRNRSEVLALAPGVNQFDLETAFTGIGSFAIVGQPYGALFGTRWNRAPDGQLLIGTNGLPSVAAETGNIGNPFPRYTLGIRNTFSYRGLSLSSLIDIRSGGQIWNGTYGRLNRLGISKITEDRDRDYVIPGVLADGSPNTQAVSAFTYFNRYLGDNGGANEQFVQDGSWVRLRELTLAYNFGSPHFLPFVKGLELYTSGTNLYLKTNYKGIDPETSLTGADSNVSGFDYFNMPNVRTYRFGLKANF